MTLSASSFSATAIACELAAHRAVDDFVTDLDVHAADQVAVDAHLRLDLALEAFFQIGHQVRELRSPSSGKAEVICASTMPSRSFLSCSNMREISGSSRQPAVVDQHAGSDSAPRPNIALAASDSEQALAAGPR